MTFVQLCAAGVSANGLFDKCLGNLELIKADAKPPSEMFLKVPDARVYPEDFQEWLDDLTESYFVYPHNQDETFLASLTSTQGGKYKSMVSSPAVIKLLIEKDRLYDMLRDLGIETLEYDIVGTQNRFSDLHFYKPTDGCGAAFAFKGQEFPESFLKTKILYGTEYTVDLLANKGEIVDYCARERLKAHGGICVHARIIGQDKIIEEEMEALVSGLGLHGPFAIQGFLAGKKFVVTDINHRFGGGVGMSVLAGWKGVEKFLEYAKTGQIKPRKSTIKQTEIRRVYKEIIILGEDE